MKDNKDGNKPIYNELAAVDNSGYGDVEFLIDEQLGDLGDGLSPYRLLLKDAQLAACYQQRFNAFISKDWHVVAGSTDQASKKAADFVKEQITALNWDDINLKMAYGRHYGYAVAELMYQQDGQYIALEDIYVREQRRFEINRNGLFLLDGMSKKAMPPQKFWTYICGNHNHDQQMGLGLAYQLYWPVWFKRHAAKFWAMYVEKFAKPTAIVTYPDNNANDEVKAKALEVANKLGIAKGYAIPKGVLVEWLQVAADSSGVYEKFIGHWNDAISKVILGQKGTTEVGQYVGTAKAHTKVARDIIKADADLLCGSFNKQVIPTLCQFNFPNAAPPRIRRDLETAEEREMRIKEDKELFALGWQRTDESFIEAYGGGFERAQTPIKKNISLEFSEPAHKMRNFTYTDTGEIADKLANEASPHMQEILSKIKDLASSKEIKDLDQLAQELIKLYPELDDDSFNRLMGEAMQYSYLQGSSDEQ